MTGETEHSQKKQKKSNKTGYVNADHHYYIVDHTDNTGEINWIVFDKRTEDTKRCYGDMKGNQLRQQIGRCGTVAGSFAMGAVRQIRNAKDFFDQNGAPVPRAQTWPLPLMWSSMCDCCIPQIVEDYNQLPNYMSRLLHPEKPMRFVSLCFDPVAICFSGSLDATILALIFSFIPEEQYYSLRLVSPRWLQWVGTLPVLAPKHNIQYSVPNTRTDMPTSAAASHLLYRNVVAVELSIRHLGADRKVTLREEIANKKSIIAAIIPMLDTWTRTIKMLMGHARGCSDGTGKSWFGSELVFDAKNFWSVFYPKTTNFWKGYYIGSKLCDGFIKYRGFREEPLCKRYDGFTSVFAAWPKLDALCDCYSPASCLVDHRTDDATDLEVTVPPVALEWKREQPAADTDFGLGENFNLYSAFCAEVEVVATVCYICVDRFFSVTPDPPKWPLGFEVFEDEVNKAVLPSYLQPENRWKNKIKVEPFLFRNGIAMEVWYGLCMGQQKQTNQCWQDNLSSYVLKGSSPCFENGVFQKYHNRPTEGTRFNRNLVWSYIDDTPALNIGAKINVYLPKKCCKKESAEEVRTILHEEVSSQLLDAVIHVEQSIGAEAMSYCESAFWTSVTSSLAKEFIPTALDKELKFGVSGMEFHATGIYPLVNTLYDMIRRMGGYVAQKRVVCHDKNDKVTPSKNTHIPIAKIWPAFDKLEDGIDKEIIFKGYLEAVCTMNSFLTPTRVVTLTPAKEIPDSSVFERFGDDMKPSRDEIEDSTMIDDIITVHMDEDEYKSCF